ncbi:MAE_28990/MAE_18760 family HEPN-like nuclease [Dyadobacter sp. Leaf189]|uniref:MAE_28990/MAE_18760 family HEPN-like nuclease n=1 Tax=Dyadobacter sp. Leaf189 TaxID=1736295 RepID=UPI0006FA94CD|nr:MAE_28990/MAE_18760 family HEPN-like nuclease [Dyadobacter sp. Leaf189]KQS27982.1 hypothetical protein ASG33_16430 [Dyadobacter sp. Leaf189]
MKYEQFESLLDEDLAWRKLEISELMLLAKTTEKDVVFKSLILLLYAHWEGYIKKSSKLYMLYISEKKILLNALSSNFKAVALKDHVSKCFDSKNRLNLANEIAFVSAYSKFENKKFKLVIDLNNDFDSSIIDTESNLKPKVFRNIHDVLGLQYKQCLRTREHYINSHLLANRNAIGHGTKVEKSMASDFSLSVVDIEKLKAFVFSIIDNFREELLQYVYEELYLLANHEKRLKYQELREKELENQFAVIESTL